jgi:hypothetical protein
MRVAAYTPEDQCLYIHEPELIDWIDDPWIKRGDALLSLRDLFEDPNDPGLEAIEGIVLDSSADGWSGKHPVVKDGFIRWRIGSPDRFLDEFTAVFQRSDEEEWTRLTLRETDEASVIRGPVRRIVFADLDSD